MESSKRDGDSISPRSHGATARSRVQTKGARSTCRVGKMCLAWEKHPSPVPRQIVTLEIPRVRVTTVQEGARLE